VTAPYWRSDIKQDVDLIEEVARINGYDKIPATLLADTIPPQDPSPEITLKRRVRRALAGYGFQEIVSYTLTGLELLSQLDPDAQPPQSPMLRVVKPMTADQEYLRPNLRAGLLAALAANRRHEDGGIRLFEIGKIYVPQGDALPAEPELLAGILSGARTESSWLGDGGGSYDFYDVKGSVAGMLASLGISARYEKSDDPGLHPARQAAIVVGEDGASLKLGVLGELHPRVAANFEIEDSVCIFEIDITALAPLAVAHRMYRAVPRFPATIRDLALVVDSAVTHQQVVDIIAGFPLVSQVRLFDVYSGQQVAAGQKSLAYRLVYQSPSHTLTDEEVNKVQEKILKRLGTELGATLRG